MYYAKKFSYVLATGKTPDALLKEAEADLAKTRDEMVQLAAPKSVEQALAEVALAACDPAHLHGGGETDAGHRDGLRQGARTW